jgi:hypothetical protein
MDNSYAQTFLSNFSNYSLVEVQDYLKQIKFSDVFHSTKEDKSQVIPKAKTDADRAADFITLNILWLGGDLSFAYDPNSLNYLHRSNKNINLNLGVINQMTVGNIKS